MKSYTTPTVAQGRMHINYVERGHSQMEGDSVHATIENSTKRLEVYSPDDWI